MTTAAAVKERPILFSDPMVRAILDGRKTQTRRVIRPQPCVPAHIRQITPHELQDGGFGFFGEQRDYKCQFGRPGDRLWVREGLRRAMWGDRDNAIQYTADDDYPWDWDTPAQWVWKRDHLPSIHCPRGLSRITLEITDVRVQRVQDITEEDAQAEGVDGCPASSWAAWAVEGELRAGFADLWDRINGPREPKHIRRRRRKGKLVNRPLSGPGPYSWDANPWVWAITFRRVIDLMEALKASLANR